MKGYIKDLLDLLIKRHHLTPLVLPTGGFGASPYPNGSWPGMMGAVTSGVMQSNILGGPRPGVENGVIVLYINLQ